MMRTFWHPPILTGLILMLAVPLALLAKKAFVILGVLLAIACFICLLQRPAARRFWPQTLPLLFLVPLIAGLLSLFWSYDLAESYRRLLHLCAPLLAAVIIYAGLAQRTDKRYAGPTKRWVGLVAGGMTIGCLLIISHNLGDGRLLSFLGAAPDYPDRELRLSLSNAAICVLAVLSIPAVTMLRANRQNLAAGLLFCLSAVAVFVGESMAAQLAFVGAIITAAFLRLSARTGYMLIGACLIILTLAPALTALQPAKPFTWLREQAAAENLSLPPSALHRTYIYDFVLQRGQERPFAGWGIGVARRLPGSQARIAELNREFLPSHPHSHILEVWVELGLFGLLLMATIMAVIWRQLYKLHLSAPVQAAALGAAFVAYWTAGLLAYSLWSSWWLAAGIVLFASLQWLAKQKTH